IPGHGGERVIELANVARNPLAIWFNTPENGEREAGTQWPLNHIFKVSFELEIGSVGERRDNLRKYQGEIVVKADGSLPRFTLESR
ncbi:MAG TPA: hypothetical protein VM690_03185, partial [Gaiellaceae bacterium]|nr:hypothetical protein [Gaiellaceae bacterium]